MPLLPPPFSPDLKVLVLAGSEALPTQDTCRLDVRDHPEVPLAGKAFLKLRGRLVVERVLDLLEATGLHQIWVLGPRVCLEQIPTRYAFTPLHQSPGASLAANLRAAQEAVEMAEDEPVLTIFGDHPLITATALIDFLGLCGPLLEEADYFHGLALREAYADYAPYFQRTSVLTREAAGRATGLNLIVPSRLHRVPAFDHIYSVRKLEQVGRFLNMLVRELYLLGDSGPAAVFDSLRLYIAKEFEKLSRHRGILGKIGCSGMDWLRRQVSVTRIERYAARLLGAERGVRVIPVAHGGTAIDVDFAEELATLEEHWETLVALAHEQDEASRAAHRAIHADLTTPAAGGR